MRVSVVVPTFRRPASLEQCLHGLSRQERAPDEVLIVTQAGDTESHELLAKWEHFRPLRVLRLTTTGAIAQYNAGLAAAQGDIVAITDDDAVPRPDWLLRIERHFVQHSDLGGVGGRDYVIENNALLTGPAPQVGTVQWFGRIVGNHHLGTRFFPDVDVLKGVNMAFRGEAIKDLHFDSDLRGGGAQTCLDMAFSMHVKKRGWRLLYDPEVAVDHFPAPRYDADQRGRPSLQAIEDTSFNLYLTLLRHMRPGIRRRAALLWTRMVGLERSPGLIRGLLARLRGDRGRVEMRKAANRAWTAAKRAGGHAAR